MYFYNRLGKTLFVLLTMIGFAATTHAQSASGKECKFKCGISAAVQGDQLDILVPLWLSHKIVLSPAFYLTSVSNKYTDLGLGLAIRDNLRSGNAVPYAGVRVGVLVYTPSGGSGVMDYLCGPFIGGEYLFDPHFSVGVEAQVNVTKSKDDSWRFNNAGGTNINTATAVIATFYF